MTCSSVAARPAIEFSVEGKKFIVRTDLQGIDPKNLDIKRVGDVLTIKGTRKDKARRRNRLFQTRDPLRLLRPFDLAAESNQDRGFGSEFACAA